VPFFNTLNYNVFIGFHSRLDGNFDRAFPSLPRATRQERPGSPHAKILGVGEIPCLHQRSRRPPRRATATNTDPLDMTTFPRRTVVRLLVAALIGAGMCPPAGSAVAAPVVTVKPAPHRAVYRMTLRSARNSSKISDVRGAMMFEQADACDGWTTEQRFQLRFSYVEGEEMDMTTNYTTWEAKNGLRYRFNVRKLVNGETDEEIRGSARLKSRGGSGEAHYLMPDASTSKLPAGTLFPTAHTLALLNKAAKGEKFYNRVVFDGADAEGAAEVSAVIAKGRPFETAIDSPLLRGQTMWPIRMAFFASDGAETPEYEISSRLLANGVVGGMQIDYGDFIVDVVLEKIETLPKTRC